MAKPFTFYFSHGTHDTPKLMVIADLQATCGLCGYTEIQRFYHSTPFHSLNLSRFAQLIADAPALLAYDCSNCGSAVTPAMADRGALTVGFPDGAGVIQAHIRCAEARVERVGYTLQGDTHLDPQALPPWSARVPVPDGDHLADLDEDVLFDVCARVFSIKGAWRALWDDHTDSGESFLERVAPGCWLAMGPDEDEVEALVEEVADDDLRDLMDRGLVTIVPIHDPPEGLPWFGTEGLLHGALDRWIQPEALTALSEHRVVAEVYMRPDMALEALTGALSRARLEFQVQESPEDTYIAQVTSPRGQIFETAIALSEVLTLAAHTGITPGSAGRMVAEEIVAEMLGIDL